MNRPARRKTCCPGLSEMLILHNLAARRVARLCIGQHIHETSRRVAGGRRLAVSVHCSACCARAGGGGLGHFSAPTQSHAISSLRLEANKRDRDIAGLNVLVARANRPSL